MLVPHNLSIESLTVDMPNALELRLSGQLVSQTAQAQLKQHLTGVHRHIVTLKATSFTVDVRHLTFVNSSVLRLFIDWIALAQRAGYMLVFLTDQSVTWHRLSFSALKSLAPASVEIRNKNAEAAPL